MGQNQLTGIMGESAAADYLTSIGHRIISKNYRIPGAEIDLITCRGQCLYIIEVKASRFLNGEFDPLERVDARKIARLRRATGRYLSDHPINFSEIRFAVVVVEGTALPAPKIEFYDVSD